MTSQKTRSDFYLSLLAIIVESAALYSVFALIFLITYAINDPVNQIFLAFASFTQVCLCFPGLFSRVNIAYALLCSKSVHISSSTASQTVAPSNGIPY